MRKAIYLALSERLKASGLGILRISLWNNDLERITANTAFRTPAVFIEFEPIEWRQRSLGARDADVRVHLHIITRTSATPEKGGKYQTQALAHLDLADRINAVVQGFSGDGFNTFTLVGTIPDHEHDQLIHEDLIYATHVVDTSAMKLFVRVRPQPVVTTTIKKSRQP
jgi:hypothetical protein